MSFWYKYWRRKGHVAKQLVEQFVGIDVSWMYKKKALFDPKGETIALLGVKLIFFSDRVEVFCFYPLTPSACIELKLIEPSAISEAVAHGSFVHTRIAVADIENFIYILKELYSAESV